ncbi:MAG: hypothetical protein IKS83_07985 [Victivallales bacterium]|nr:hypothetical protein [Victivallales bacterium]
MRRYSQSWLLFIAFALSVWGAVPEVTRQFSSGQIGPGSAIRVSLTVHFPDGDEALPGAWLLAEHWARGWTLDGACWNGEPLAPARQVGNDTTRYWLFGGDAAPPVSNGVLTYILHAPESFSASNTMNSADGAVYTRNGIGFVGGDATLLPEESAQPQNFRWLAQPGWSLVALPCELDEPSREMLSSLGGAFFQISRHQELYCQGGVPQMGVPFWFYNPSGEEFSCELTAALLTETPEPLCAAAPVRHQRWNLFGVCGENPVRLATGITAWRWRNGHYEPCEANAILLPGEAVWLYVE